MPVLRMIGRRASLNRRGVVAPGLGQLPGLGDHGPERLGVLSNRLSALIPPLGEAVVRGWVHIGSCVIHVARAEWPPEARSRRWASLCMFGRANGSPAAGRRDVQEQPTEGPEMPGA